MATLTAYQHDVPRGWHQSVRSLAWQADVGYAGFAPPGQKREGDGRTPSGSFGFDFLFGVLTNPGVQFPFRPVTGPNIVWDDDPSSPDYNQWVDTDTANAGTAPEPMDVAAYDYGAVIARTTMAPASCPVPAASPLSPCLGWVADGGMCVAARPTRLLSVLRWLSPAAQPRIIMGTASTIAPVTSPAFGGGPVVSPRPGSGRSVEAVTDLFDVVHRQRACRNFSDEAVDDSLVEKVLDAATFAPSAENRQPWVFVVVRDAAKRSAIGALTRQAWEGGRAFTPKADWPRASSPTSIRGREAVSPLRPSSSWCVETRGSGTSGYSRRRCTSPSRTSSWRPTALGLGSSLTTLALLFGWSSSSSSACPTRSSPWR